VVFISVLLDVFAAFFIGLIGEELRFNQGYKNKKSSQIKENSNDDDNPDTDMAILAGATLDEQNSQNLNSETLDTPELTAQYIVPEAVKSIYQQAIEALESKAVRCSKRAMSPFLKITTEQADALFEQLMQEGLVSKKPNHHYRWHGIEQVTSDNEVTSVS
jgi:hypothetical protein